MAYFASVVDNTITNVIVIDNNDCLNYLGNFSEEIGAEFCAKNFGSDKLWIQVKEERPGGIGHTYDSVNDVFIAPRPYQSWTLNSETFKWESPIPEPELTEEQREQRYLYVWSEELYTSDNTKGWLLIPHNT